MSISIESLLADANVSITAYKPRNKKPYIVNNLNSYDMEGLCEAILVGLGQTLHTSYSSLVLDLAVSKDISNILNPYINTKFNSPSGGEIPAVFLNCELNTDVDTGEFFLTRDDVVMNMDAKVYASMLGIKESSIVTSSRVIGRKYNPFCTDRIISVPSSDGVEYEAINTYIEPLWKKEHTSDAADISLFTKLIDHLFPVDTDREYFYAWAKVALTTRAYTYLVLSGRGGNGKNTLKEVFRGLVGELNLTDGKMSTIRERFNGQLDKTRILWGDEWKFGFSEEPVLKEIQNDYISIERKGVDATRSTQIYCSMVITNNYPEHNYIAFDSRKFVPLLMTDKELHETMTSDEISALRLKVDHSKGQCDPDFLASVHKFILETGDETKFRNLEYKGPGFYRLANLTMFKWQKFIIEVLVFIFQYKTGSAVPEKMFKRKSFTSLMSKVSDNTSKWNDILYALDTSSRSSGTSEFPGNLKVHTFLSAYRTYSGDKLFEVGTLEGISEDFSITYIGTKDSKALIDTDDKDYDL